MSRELVVDIIKIFENSYIGPYFRSVHVDSIYQRSGLINVDFYLRFHGITFDVTVSDIKAIFREGLEDSMMGRFEIEDSSTKLRLTENQLPRKKKNQVEILDIVLPDWAWMVVGVLIISFTIMCILGFISTCNRRNNTRNVPTMSPYTVSRLRKKMTVDGIYNDSYMEDIITDGSNLSGSSYLHHTSIREDKELQNSSGGHAGSREDKKCKNNSYLQSGRVREENNSVSQHHVRIREEKRIPRQHHTGIREEKRNPMQHHTSIREENRNTSQYIENIKQDGENRNRSRQYEMSFSPINVSRGEGGRNKNEEESRNKNSYNLQRKKSGRTVRPHVISSDEDVCYSNILMNETYKNILLNDSYKRNSSRMEKGGKYMNSPRRHGDSRQQLVSSSDEEIDYNILTEESSGSSNLGEKAKRFVYTKDSWSGGRYATPVRKQRTPLPGFETPRYVEDEEKLPSLPKTPDLETPRWVKDLPLPDSPQTTSTYDSSEFSSDSAESSVESPTNMVRMLSYRKIA